METPTFSTLWSTFQSCTTEADQQHQQGDEDWWKTHESALAIIGSISTELIDHIKQCSESNQSPQFGLEHLFTQVVPNYLTASKLPFLQGRSFVFASQFSKALPGEMSTQYIDAAMQVLAASEPGVPVKVSAVRALNK